MKIDPDDVLKRLVQAAEGNDEISANNEFDYLVQWLRDGGYPPDWRAYPGKYREQIERALRRTT